MGAVTIDVLSEEQWAVLSRKAWEVRDNAYILGKTKVGAAVMAKDGAIFMGCNINHRFRSHDIHAEVNAIASMVAAGHTDLVAVVVAAERERFTPCGACMDWIFQFGGPVCLVGYQTKVDGKLTILQAQELMPYYPI